MRGINRYVIEMNDPENKYFDKVVLYVKPEFSEKNSSKLKSEGKKIIYKTEFENNVNRPAKISVITLILSALVGAAISLSIYLIFFGF